MVKLKKLLVIMLSFAISLSIMPIQMEAAKKVKLNRSNLTLYVGKTAKLTIKNTDKKVKWSSSGRSVATVTQNGSVRAKGKGSCRVTAKVGGKKYVCKVIVKRKASKVKKPTTYVYVTKTGSKYHRSGCRYLKYSRRKVSLSSAKSCGYTACSVCW